MVYAKMAGIEKLKIINLRLTYIELARPSKSVARMRDSAKYHLGPKNEFQSGNLDECRWDCMVRALAIREDGSGSPLLVHMELPIRWYVERTAVIITSVLIIETRADCGLRTVIEHHNVPCNLPVE